MNANLRSFAFIFVHDKIKSYERKLRSGSRERNLRSLRSRERNLRSQTPVNTICVHYERKLTFTALENLPIPI